MVKFSKFCYESLGYMATSIDVLFKCRKNLSDGKSLKSHVIYLTKNWLPFKLSLLLAWITPKIYLLCPQH